MNQQAPCAVGDFLRFNRDFIELWDIHAGDEYPVVQIFEETKNLELQLKGKKGRLYWNSIGGEDCAASVVCEEDNCEITPNNFNDII